MKSIFLRSPAKINLCLKVLNKRPDGYHDLSTLFEKISLYDDLRFVLTSSGKIRILCDHSSIPCGPKNLIYKAARMLQMDFGISQGVDIHLTKRIPVAAGLAGGSSNAASTLLGLNKLWHLHLPPKTLIAYAKRLGSDVPLFIYKYNFCIGTGRGDRIRKVRINKKLWHVIIAPRLKVYSGEVFRAVKRKLTKRNDNANILTHELRKKDLRKVSQFLSNDLEAAIVRVHPQLRTIKNNIQRISGLDVCFSGSGPSIFGLVPTRKKAQVIAEKLGRHYAYVVVVRTL